MPIDDYLVQQTEEEIAERILGNMPPHRDLTQGGFVFDSIMPLALELVLGNERARLILELVFAQTTAGEYLDLRAEEHGLVRNMAVAAHVAEFLITGDPATVVPAGTKFSTTSIEGGPEAQLYSLDDEVILDGVGEGIGTLTADEPGSAGNVPVDAISLIEGPIAGVATYTNATAATGGFDEESDTDLLVRYLLRVRNPGSSGNRADYVQWALAIAGVGGVTVVPVEDGPNTVTVSIIDANKAPADAPLVDLVQTTIAPDGPNGGGLAPIGANVTVEAATAVNIDLVADLTIEAGFDEPAVEAAAQANVDAYIKSLAFTDDNDVRHAKIVTSLIDTPGVTDATGVTINGGAVNVVIGQKEVAVLDDVTFS